MFFEAIAHLARFARGCLALALLAACAGAGAGVVRVAVASNFSQPMQRIAAAFEQGSGHSVQLSSGSTAKLYAQISNGAPFDVLLAADAETPARLERERLAFPGTRFCYAIGRLALWSARPGLVEARGDVLKNSAAFERLAIANPKLAPYGTAALDVLRQLGLEQTLAPKLVLGDNIAQTWQFVATGNAALGFVALSQIMREGRIEQGSAWVVPQALHAPLRQDAVRLTSATGDAGAVQALLDFLKSAAARTIVASYGYGFDP